MPSLTIEKLLKTNFTMDIFFFSIYFYRLKTKGATLQRYLITKQSTLALLKHENNVQV